MEQEDPSEMYDLLSAFHINNSMNPYGTKDKCRQLGLLAKSFCTNLACETKFPTSHSITLRANFIDHGLL